MGTLLLWSLALAAVGLGVSRWGASRLQSRVPAVTPRGLWVTGLPALLLAWLVPFVSLLNAAGGSDGPPRKAFMGASAAAILGVLVTDWLIAREEKRGAPPRPTVWWLLGAVALVPAWLVALLLASRVGG